ncbi:hypothetical protein M0804_008089 [Polistes exclamans]|nr:hypothetical protein M0804_008089 [Polistes exclamans]
MTLSNSFSRLGTIFTLDLNRENRENGKQKKIRIVENKSFYCNGGFLFFLFYLNKNQPNRFNGNIDEDEDKEEENNDDDDNDDEDEDEDDDEKNTMTMTIKPARCACLVNAQCRAKPGTKSCAP